MGTDAAWALMVLANWIVGAGVVHMLSGGRRAWRCLRASAPPGPRRRSARRLLGFALSSAVVGGMADAALFVGSTHEAGVAVLYWARSTSMLVLTALTVMKATEEAARLTE